MPNYLYRSKLKKAIRDCQAEVFPPDCPCWGDGVSVYQHFDAKPLEDCPGCGGLVYRAIVGIKFRFRHGMKGDCHDYRDDLARYVGDPEAYVDGPRSLQKLIDKRKRAGWTVTKGFDAPTSAPTSMRSSEEVVREAYERAAAKGFMSDDDSE